MDNEKKPPRRDFVRVLPFFIVLGLVSVISMILPLRPKVSYAEKRPLAQLPEFSVQTLISGEYFNDISLWFSDTFPGREGWLDVSQNIAALHGYGSISIQGELPESLEIPQIPAPTALILEEEPTEETVEETEPETTSPEETAEPSETEEARQEEPALMDAIISSSAIIQIGDSGYHALGFSKPQSDSYIRNLSKLAAEVEVSGVRVISAPCPTAIGINVDPAMLPRLKSVDQGELLDYMHGSMADNVVTVNTHKALLAHKGEYMFFHTDHHWTALGAYYSYQEVCRTLGMSAAALEDFEQLDEGEFQGSIYGRCAKPRDLAKDYVIAYIPPGNVYMKIWDGMNGEWDGQIVRDLRNAKITSKYLSFLESDQAMVRVCNDDLPDAGNCLIIKDSFGNCLVPFFSQNYHNVYAIDYRKYTRMTVQRFCEKYDIQDVIFAPNMMSTQSINGANLLAERCGYRN